MGKSGKEVSPKDQAALKVASAKRWAEQEALRSPKKAKTPTPAVGVGTRSAGKAAAGTETTLVATNEEGSSEEDEEREE